MRYTIKTKSADGFGTFTVLVNDAREALKVVKDIAERGTEEVEILNENGAPCKTVELERIASDTEFLR